MPIRTIQDRIMVGIGAACILVGVICNEWVLAYFLSADKSLSASSVRMVRIVEIILIGFGVMDISFRRSEVIVKVNLMLTSLVFSLVAFEGYLRLSDIFKDQMSVNRLRIQDPYLNHTLRKNVSVSTTWFDTVSVMYHTNSLGYRDRSQRDILQRTPARHRIVFLGDSFTESVAVEYEDSFIAQLEERFHKEGQDVEILNSGVVSYAPSLEYRKLKQFLDLGYHTDEVILMLDMSDLAESFPAWLNFTRISVPIRFRKCSEHTRNYGIYHYMISSMIFMQ